MIDLKCEHRPKMYRFTFKNASQKRVGQSGMQVKKINVKLNYTRYFRVFVVKSVTVFEKYAAKTITTIEKFILVGRSCTSCSRLL